MKVDLKFPSTPAVSVEAKDLICKVSLCWSGFRISFGEKKVGLWVSDVVFTCLDFVVASGEGFIQEAVSSKDPEAPLDRHACRSIWQLLRVRWSSSKGHIYQQL